MTEPSLDKRLSRLVDLAYAAALDDSLWERWAWAALQEFGGRGGLFSIVDDRGPKPERTISLWRDARILEEYLGGFVQFDPQLAAVASLDRSLVYRDAHHLDLRSAETREFTAWIAGFGVRHHITGVVLLGDGSQRACLSLHYRADEEAVAVAQEKRLAAILPALEHALDFGFRQGELVTAAFWDGITTVEDGRAAILLDERGRIMNINAAAHRLVSMQDGLTLSSAVLGCDRPADQLRLAGVIAGAIRPAGAVAGALRLGRQSGRHPLLVTVYPLARTRRMIAPLEAAAVMTIIDPAQSPVPRPSLWQTAFALTGREAEFAGLLSSGHSVESAAATLQMAIPTARTHLRNIFQKTGTDRQSGLLQLLGRLA